MKICDRCGERHFDLSKLETKNGTKQLICSACGKPMSTLHSQQLVQKEHSGIRRAPEWREE